MITAGRTNSAGLRSRVINAAEDTLAEQRYVSVVDIICRLGWIDPVNVEAWRKARVLDLSSLLPVPAERMSQAVEHMTEWARERGLAPVEVDYVAATRDRRRLTFLASGAAETERAFRTHWFPPDTSPDTRERSTERPSREPELVVFLPRGEWRCATCDGSSPFLFKDGAAAVCLDCADLGHLVFLPSGDAALTRRASKASRLRAVVVRWAPTRKRYERQGILVEEDALEQAEQRCLDDAEVRQRRRERERERTAQRDATSEAALAAEIRRLFPGCPPDRGRGDRPPHRHPRQRTGRPLGGRASAR